MVEATAPCGGVVANDTELGEKRVQVVTGANLSGKSVYLKQADAIKIIKGFKKRWCGIQWTFERKWVTSRLPLAKRSVLHGKW